MEIGHPLWTAPATQMAPRMCADTFLVLPRGNGLLFSAVHAPPVSQDLGPEACDQGNATPMPPPHPPAATPSLRGALRSCTR